MSIKNMNEQLIVRWGEVHTKTLKNPYSRETAAADCHLSITTASVDDDRNNMECYIYIYMI